jgi:DeoR/GlpR family transcriptional regulator of sugar metabolism
MRWFEQHRQDWIAEALSVYGFINREHLERKFGVSTPQASKDLATFQRLNPKAMAYNLTTKRYEVRG